MTPEVSPMCAEPSESDKPITEAEWIARGAEGAVEDDAAWLKEQTEQVERIAREFHETYEMIAPEHEYETRAETAVSWEELPEPNRELMCSTVADLIEREVILPAHLPDEPNVTPTTWPVRVRALEREWDGWERKYQERLVEIEQLREGIDKAVRAMEACQYVGGPPEHEAWRTVWDALALLATRPKGVTETKMDLGDKLRAAPKGSNTLELPTGAEMVDKGWRGRKVVRMRFPWR
jgi:hypothetical protein